MSARKFKDYYSILKVARNATQADIKKAYVQLAKIYHPDLLESSDPKKAFKEATFKEITEAYSVLNNPRRRSEYNLEIYELEKEKAANHSDIDGMARPPPDPITYELSEEEKQALGIQLKKIRNRKIRRLFIIVLVLFGIGWYFKLKYIFLRMYNRDINNKVIFKDKEGVDSEMIEEVNKKFVQELQRVREEREKMNIMRHPTKKMTTTTSSKKQENKEEE
ncbi:hypothetical protein FDP41_003527 [Naegleria fowleri]|uniref:J domain-containing protein n=1 Tax=Naegleria fowleri TaxID=5763 RepID=A0A6A5BW33_NAEFO|nr:uncharacterized protein FDP41_003527 [Naegleria fowleri]KAF0977535.1 hypothetical protein FDP41_003527 [Naegleria fowleri]CAG4709319.1 unnamed protein product [Naegleria fowleri]